MPNNPPYDGCRFFLEPVHIQGPAFIRLNFFRSTQLHGHQALQAFIGQKYIFIILMTLYPVTH